MQRKFYKKILFFTLALGFVSIFSSIFYYKVEKARAANMTMAYVKLDRLAASTATSGTVCAKSTTVGVEAKVIVTFPTGFTVNATAANWTTTTTNLPSGSTAWIGIGTATLASGQAVTFPSGDMVVGTLYCFNFSGTTTLTNGTAGNDKLGAIETQTSGSAQIDYDTWATSIVSNDQIIVTATVPATFTFALSGNTDSFTSNLSSSSVTPTSGRTTTITTNASNGWVTWVKSANAGLNSAVTASSIATAGSIDDAPTDLSATTGYVLDVDITTDNATGTGVVSQAAGYGAEYNGTNTTSGGTLSTTFQPIAACSGTTAGDVLTLIERAKVIATQPASSDYTDTLTVIAAGRF